MLPASEVAREPFAPARLVRQAVHSEDPQSHIKPGDSISIYLRTAFLAEFQSVTGDGEIAIVVKAFEFGKGDDFNFNPEGVREGRMVFYSPDVRKKTGLEFQ